MAGWEPLPPEEGTPPPPYFPSSDFGQTDTAAEIVVYGKTNGDGLLIQFRNLRANGKVGLVGQVGRADNTSDLGITGSIGAAPDGAWCSDPTSGDYIWSSLTYQSGGVTYTGIVSGRVTYTQVP